MDIKIEKTEIACESKATVVVEGDEWKNAQEEALNDLANKVELKGFRKGHAPIELAKRQVSEINMLNKAGDKMIDKAYKDVVSNKDLKIALQPSLSIEEFSKEKLSFTITMVTMPEVTLGAYKDIEIAKEVKKVTKEDIDAELKTKQENASELVVVKEGQASKLHDTVIIDFEGFVDGVAFEGGKGTNYELELGSNTFIPGFEDQLVGKTKGEKVDVNVTFPEKYVENLAGKAATFKVTINEIKEKVVPELNDDFAKELDLENIDTLDQLKESIKADLKKKNEEAAVNEQKEKLIDTVVNNATFVVHEKIVEEEANAIVANFENRLTQQGLNADDYYKMTNTTKEDMANQAKETATNNLKHMFVLDKVATTEDIKVTKEEIEAKFNEFAKMYNMKVEDVRKQLEPRMSEFVNSLREEKTIKFLNDSNKLA